jgi:hypothetical protein
MPPRPPTRDGEISDELLSSFDRVLTIRNLIKKLEDELAPLDKRLEWTFMAETFGDHWVGNMVSPADEALDAPRHAPIGDRQIDLDWPLLQRDRQTLLGAHAEWKQRKHQDD